MTATVTVSVVTVAYGAEPWLERGVHASLASEDEVVEVVLVDHGCTDGAVDRLDGTPGVTVVRPGDNTGFAGGCNLGAAHSTAPIIAFVNPDAIVEPDALAVLAAEVRRTGGIATACVVLADRPDLVNSAGNEFHFLGLSWSGGFEEPVADHQVAKSTIAASGAGMAMTSELFATLGGFCDEFFAYYEDADLSIRAHQLGHPVRYLPGARIVHRYEFGRNEKKFFLLDRNRWLTLLSCYAGRTLIVLAPLLIAQEVALWALAVTQGWAGSKRRSYAWLWSHREWIRERRSQVQSVRVVGDRELSPLIRGRLDPANLELPAWAGPASSALDWIWRGLRQVI